MICICLVSCFRNGRRFVTSELMIASGEPLLEQYKPIIVVDTCCSCPSIYRVINIRGGCGGRGERNPIWSNKLPEDEIPFPLILLSVWESYRVANCAVFDAKD
uniref:Uncharacterized protein n=1 Tax=Kalanchoe fedtschenkoi TaxID=63787 RepID=A0A7N0TLR3_KALFE